MRGCRPAFLTPSPARVLGAPRWKHGILPLTLLASMAGAGCQRAPQLTTIVSGGSGPPTLVLLHGYGSSAGNWVPFTQTIRWPARGQFVFPQAPGVTVPPDGPADGRAWWRLDLFSHIPPGQSSPDLSATRPEGLEESAALVEDLIARLERSPGAPIVLGGFSQGAMVAGEVAFRSDAHLRAVVLLSGTLVDQASWERGFGARRGTPVFLAHGRNDPVLPFALADRLRTKLQAAGVDVTWCPFDGGHEIPATVVIELNKFIGALRLGD